MLAKCSECGRKVSSRAKQCPGCGDDLTNQRKSEGVAAIMAIAVVAIILIGPGILVNWGLGRFIQTKDGLILSSLSDWPTWLISVGIWILLFSGIQGCHKKTISKALAGGLLGVLLIWYTIKISDTDLFAGISSSRNRTNFFPASWHNSSAEASPSPDTAEKPTESVTPKDSKPSGNSHGDIAKKDELRGNDIDPVESKTNPGLSQLSPANQRASGEDAASRKTSDSPVLQSLEGVSIPVLLVATEDVALLDQFGKETTLKAGAILKVQDRKARGTLSIESNNVVYVGNESRILGKVKVGQ